MTSSDQCRHHPHLLGGSVAEKRVLSSLEPYGTWSSDVHQGRPWKVAPMGPGKRDSPSVGRGQSPLWSLQWQGRGEEGWT